jgi:hypothetical protein
MWQKIASDILAVFMLFRFNFVHLMVKLFQSTVAADCQCFFLATSFTFTASLEILLVKGYILSNSRITGA